MIQLNKVIIMAQVSLNSSHPKSELNSSNQKLNQIEESVNNIAKIPENKDQPKSLFGRVKASLLFCINYVLATIIIVSVKILLKLNSKKELPKIEEKKQEDIGLQEISDEELEKLTPIEFPDIEYMEISPPPRSRELPPLVSSAEHLLEKLTWTHQSIDDELMPFIANKTQVNNPFKYLLFLQSQYEYLAINPISGQEFFDLEPEAYYYFDSTGTFTKTNASYMDDANFKATLKYSNNEISLYLDGLSKMVGLYKNENFYADEDGLGKKAPSLILQKGDKIYNRDHKFLFEVGENGTLLIPKSMRVPTIKELEAGSQQAKEFHHFNSINTHAWIHNPVNGNVLLCQYAGASAIDKKLENGFYFFAIPQNLTNEDISQPGSCTIVDLKKDLLLDKLRIYFEAEFGVMKYTPEQMIIRLGTFAKAALFHTKNGRNEDENYYLGEFIKAGQNNGYHRAMLIKVLADALSLECYLVASKIDNNIDDIRMWTIFRFNNSYWLLDAEKEKHFKINSVGINSEEAKYYGLQEMINNIIPASS